MKDKDKTKEQMLIDLVNLRKQNAELQTSISQLHKVKDESIFPKQQLEHIPGVTKTGLELENKTEGHINTEKELNGTKDFLDNIIESSLDCIMVSEKGHISMVNNALTKLLGYSEDELQGKGISKIIPVKAGTYTDTAGEKVQIDQDRISRSKKIQSMLLKKEKISVMQDFYIRKDGQVVQVEQNIAPLCDRQGSVIGSVWSARDITKRNKAERDIKESRDFLENIFESSMDGILIVDPMGNILSANSAVEKMSRYNKAELKGMHASQLALYDESTKDKYIGQASKLLKNGFCSYEAQYKTKDGRILDVEVVNSMSKNEKGDFTAGVSIIRDVTERIKTEHQLRQSHKMEALGTMAGGIAHDFNNILAIVLGNAELAIDGIPTDNPSQFNLEQILLASKRARDMVRRILVFSRQEQYSEKPVSLIRIVNENIEMLRPAIPSTIEIRKNIDCESDTVIGDITQLNQLVVNICTNAYQSMGKKGGILEVSLNNIKIGRNEISDKHVLKPGNYIKLTIRDTGIGIDPEYIDRIFDPFFTTKRQVKGTGLGLAAVSGIVRQNGGDIKVESKQGKGTVFHVFLPLVDIKAEVQAESSEPIPSGQGHILVVDDEHLLAEMLKQMLERLGYDVTVKTDSIEALEAFSSKPENFDLVITDQTMPQMTGEKLAEKILDIRGDIPIILSTGYSSQLTEYKIKSLGIKGFMMKPYNMRDIAEKVKEVL